MGGCGVGWCVWSGVGGAVWMGGGWWLGECVYVKFVGIVYE